MKEDCPLLTIIVPFYNVQDYLEQCISSVLAQTYRHLEVILIDDGSTDRSLEVCRKLTEGDRRVCVLTQQNQGVGAARNLGLSHAHGDYIGFVDSDDWVEPGMYQGLLELSLEHKADIVACAHYREGGKSGRQPLRDAMKKKTITFSGIDAFNALGEERLVRNFLWDKLFNRKLFDGIRFPERRVFEDISVLYKLLCRTERMVYWYAPQYHYRIHENSLTNGEYDVEWKYRLMMALSEPYTYGVENKLWKKPPRKFFRSCVHLLNRLIMLPDSPAHRAMKQDCVAFLRNYPQVYRMGAGYWLRRFLIVYTPSLYVGIYAGIRRKHKR